MQRIIKWLFPTVNSSFKGKFCVKNLQSWPRQYTVWPGQYKRLVSLLDESCRRYWVVLTRTPSYSRLFPADPNGITHPKMLKIEWKGCNFLLTITQKNFWSKRFIQRTILCWKPSKLTKAVYSLTRSIQKATFTLRWVM